MANAYELALELLAEHEGEETTVGGVLRDEKDSPRRTALETLVKQMTLARSHDLDEAEVIIAFYIAHPDRQI